MLPESIRDQFACLRGPVGDRPPPVYLDSAATALKPDCVIDALNRYYRETPANVHRGLHAMSEAATAAYEGARERVRAFLNARHSHEIVFTSGTTDAINLVAGGFGAMLKPGDEILITGLEHHANIVPWQFLRDRHGIVLKVVPLTDSGEIDPAAFEAALSERTRLTAFTAVSNALGTELPVKELVALSHAAGAPALVDAAQAVSCLPVDVRDWDCDFLAFSGHKLFGPTGIGVLYGRDALLESMQPFKGGGDMIRSVSFEQTTFNELPWKFEAGTPHIAGAIGLHAAIDWFVALEMTAVEAHEAALVTTALERLSAIPGLQIVGHPARRRSIVSFTLDGIHPHDAGTILDECGVAVRAGHHCAQPVMAFYGVPATVRAAFSVYNTTADIEALVAGIAHVQEILA